MYNIVLVEDNLVIIKSIELILIKAGFNINIFTDGADAISYINDNINDIDIVLCDVNIPTINGLDIIRCVRQISNVPIIVITGDKSEKMLIDCFDAGCNDFITKPLSSSILKIRMNKLLKYER